MNKLIRKDLVLHKKFVFMIGILFPVYFGYFGSRLSHSMMIPIIQGFICAILPLVLFGREDKFKSMAFGLSLPATRREIMIARYLLSWGLMLSIYVIGAFLRTIASGTKLTAAVVFEPRAVLFPLAFIAFFFAVLMPLFIQFGQTGILVFMVLLQVLGILLLAFKSLVSLRPIKAAVLFLPNTISSIQTSAGTAVAALTVAALLFLLTYASFELSMFIFRKKEF